MQNHVGTRTSTQARSHAQKVLKGKLDSPELIKSPVSPPTKKHTDFFEPLIKKNDEVPEMNEGSMVFKVEKDVSRAKARKRLFSSPDEQI